MKVVVRGMLVGALVVAGTGCAVSRTLAPGGEVVTEVEVVTREGGDEGGPGTATMTLDALTQPWGCGNGWAVSTSDQSVGLVIMPASAGADLTATSELGPGGPWLVELRIGRDLFANWCDDVMEPGEPEPVVDRTFAGVSGTLTFVGEVPPDRVDCPLTVEGDITDLVVTDGGTTIELGSGRVTNSSWGCFAG